MTVVTIQTGVTDSSRTPGLKLRFQQSMSVHCFTQLFVSRDITSDLVKSVFKVRFVSFTLYMYVPVVILYIIISVAINFLRQVDTSCNRTKR